MKVFSFLQIADAIAFALDGGVALHLHNVVFRSSPKCFKEATEFRMECIAHLFDQDKDRLFKKAKKLGIRRVYIDDEGADGQHLDLCGRPLKALLIGYYSGLYRKGKKDAIHKLRGILNCYPGSRRWI